MVMAYFGRMTFYSGVQAELKAQIADQGFANRVCQTTAATNTIVNEIYPNRATISGPKKMRYFVTVCEILSQRLLLKDVNIEDQIVCAKLLQDRCNKVASDPMVLATIPDQIAEWRQCLERFSDEIEN